jgi:hypothetical protein
MLTAVLESVSPQSNLSLTSDPAGRLRPSTTTLSSTPIDTASITPGGVCGTQTCTIRLFPTFLSYPNGGVVQHIENVTATVIPYVTSFDDGHVETHYSTYTDYTSGSAPVPFTSPENTFLTWEALGTTL